MSKAEREKHPFRIGYLNLCRDIQKHSFTSDGGLQFKKNPTSYRSFFKPTNQESLARQERATHSSPCKVLSRFLRAQTLQYQVSRRPLTARLKTHQVEKLRVRCHRTRSRQPPSRPRSEIKNHKTPRGCTEVNQALMGYFSNF